MHFGPTGPNLCLYIDADSLDREDGRNRHPSRISSCIILAKTENRETVEVATAARCSFFWHPGLVKPVLMLRLLRSKIVERYPTSLESEDLTPFSDHKEEPFIIREKMQMQEKMRDDEPWPSNRKRPREPDYDANDEDSDARSHPNLKRSKRYVIVSDEEEELDTPEDDKNRDPDYNPFFKNYDDLIQDLRRKQEEAARDPRVKKEESTRSNDEEKPLKAPFKEVNEDEFFVEDDWYEPRGLDSLEYYYSEKDIQYILRR